MPFIFSLKISGPLYQNATKISPKVCSRGLVSSQFFEAACISGLNRHPTPPPHTHTPAKMLPCQDGRGARPPARRGPFATAQAVARERVSSLDYT